MQMAGPLVSSPLNDVVTHVHAVTGEAVMSGELLFEVRLTYEDLVETQTAYLKAISELEVENREIARYEDAVQPGEFPSKLQTVIEEEDETCCRLELIIEGELLPKSRIDDLLDEANQITAIMIASRKTTSQKDS